MWYQHLVPTPCTSTYHLQNLTTSQKRESELTLAWPGVIVHLTVSHLYMNVMTMKNGNTTSQKHADLSSKPLMQRSSDHDA